MMAALIEKMVAGDVDAVKNLETICQLSPWSAEDYLAEIERSDSVSLVLKINSIVYGFLIARLIMNQDFSVIEIYNIGVDPSRQRKKFGSLLLDKLLDNIRDLTSERTCGYIHLEVRKSNLQAINFYKRNGFIETGSRKNFYSNPTDDAILMRREILYMS